MPHRAGHGKSRRQSIYSSKIKPLPSILIDCHIKCGFNRKSSSAQFEGDDKICWTYLNPGCKDSCSRANNFCYAMLCSSKPVTITCCLQRRQEKASIYTSHGFRQRQHHQILTLACLLKKKKLEKELMKKMLVTNPASQVSKDISLENIRSVVQ